MINDTNNNDDDPGDGDKALLSGFEICIILLLLVSYVLIAVLFVLLFLQRRKRKRGQRKVQLGGNTTGGSPVAGEKMMGETSMTNNEKSAVVLVGSSQIDNQDTTNKAQPYSSDHLVGLNTTSMNNPNYMSNITSSLLLKERDSKRFSVISERRYSRGVMTPTTQQVSPKLTSKVDLLPTTSERGLDEDNYSFAGCEVVGENESEHNYSLISSEECNVIGRLSSDDKEEEESEHNYSCISNSSRVPSVCSLPPPILQQDHNEEEEEILQAADYEEFYSIPVSNNASLSESDEENETINNEAKNLLLTEGDKDGFYIQNKETGRQSEPPHCSTPPPPPVPRHERKRSATSSDIFGISEPADNILLPTSIIIKVTNNNEEEKKETVTLTKPIPKPRMLRKAIKSENY